MFKEVHRVSPGFTVPAFVERGLNLSLYHLLQSERVSPGFTVPAFVERWTAW